MSKFDETGAKAQRYWNELLGDGPAAQTMAMSTMLVIFVVCLALYLPWFLPRSIFKALRSSGAA